MAKRNRRFGSVATELVKKAREAMLTAVQIFNNPQIEFKAELYIVTTVIAWTYLLHAYYKKHGVEYRAIDTKSKKKRFRRTKHGAIWHWSLEDCLECAQCPVDEIVKKNLRFLVGIRNEIEHQMTARIDDQLSAKFQAAALNFNRAIKTMFGDKYSLDAEQAISIQFSGITESTAKELMADTNLPKHIHSYIVQFENGLTDDEYNDPRFSYRVAFVRKTTNAKTVADKVVEFVPPGSDAEVEMNKVYLRDTEKQKYKPITIVNQMRAEGFLGFKMHHHTDLWKSRDARNPKHQYGVMVEGTWFWYEPWIAEVRKHCQASGPLYSTDPAKFGQKKTPSKQGQANGQLRLVTGPGSAAASAPE